MTDPSTVTDSLLEIRNLRIELASHGRTHALIEGIDLRIARGEAVALIGESGSGKSLTAFAVMNLLPPALHASGGALRWHEIRDGAPAAAMVFQNPRAALNPVRRIGQQFDDVLRTMRVPRRARAQRAVQLLEQVAMSPAQRYLRAWPHELSGGLCQRVSLALALAREAALLVADEPTTGLDAVTQSQVLTLIGELRRARRMALLLITHDLGAALHHSDRVAVMHAGQLVEVLPSRDFLRNARHPYSRALISATPALVSTLGKLRGVPGELPELAHIDRATCRFHARCANATPQCVEAAPPVVETTGGGHLRCWHPASADALSTLPLTDCHA
ncbi:ABC transporter ATP-binding protein [Paraburkholderia nodosa]|uniref:ABC transporter ATP-binding protein n=1 Tax=Paraburkholderia nodosa TaxID=392320 RepID=UPI000841B0B7|nr:ABC transporter ATP-binding protein [Paraburkholderia nodosa]